MDDTVLVSILSVVMSYFIPKDVWVCAIQEFYCPFAIYPVTWI